MRRLAALAGLLLLAGPLAVGVARAQEGGDVPLLRDVEFGVAVRAPGLERRVEMLQWTRTPQGYVRAWSDEPIDATGFAPGHANPVEWPLPGRRWLAATLRFEGRPVDPGVVAALGEWRELRPSFTALPGNMAATFQPEGDGLGSADNPLDPQVGDLRIRWRQLVLPPLQGRVVLRDGRWTMAPAPAVDPPDGGNALARTPPSPTAIVAPAPAARTAGAPRARWPWWLGGGAALLVVVLALRRRRSR